MDIVHSIPMVSGVAIGGFFFLILVRFIKKGCPP